MKKIELYFYDIDCAACASKIEGLLNKCEEIEEARVNFATKKIIVTYEDDVDILELVRKITNKIEPDALVARSLEELEELKNDEEHHEHEHEHHHHHECDENCEHEDKTVTLYFYDIDCAACASKIEGLLNKCEEIEEARVNFASKKITVTYEDNVDILELVRKTTNKIEPDALVARSLEELEELKNGEHHEHEHEHHHHHECDGNCEVKKDKKNKKENKNQKSRYLIFAGVILFFITVIIDKVVRNSQLFVLTEILYVISYILVAHKIIIKSFKNIKSGNIFDENFLMLVASVGALALKENVEALLVVILNIIGEYFQNKALGASTDAIASLTTLKVEKTTLKDGRIINTDEVKLGDELLVKAGERIPVDGIIVEGSTSLDMKALTGESIPIDAAQGEEVLSGSINLSNVITIKATKVANESIASKIISLVEEASNKKSKTEEFITKFARIYTPIVLSLALVVFLVEWLFISKFTIGDALNNAFVFLVTSCPCALVISIPLSFFGGIGKCSSFGILVKGGNYIEALTKVKTICFDKTGTLTKGNFKIKEINASEGVDEDYLLDILVAIEGYSNHPIAQAITTFRKNTPYKMENIKEVAGKGLVATYNGEVVLAGNDRLMKEYNINYEEEECPGTVVYCALGNKFLGNVLIVDEIKNESITMMKELKKLGIKTWMLTGDKTNIASQVATKLGIDNTYAELLPHQKLEKLDQIIKEENKDNLVAYIGDGINDTPSIKLADVGIAIGGFGHDEAIAASDVVLMNDKMDNLPKAIKIAMFTKHILIENIVFALVVKLIALVVGMLGLLGSYGMLLGVFADVGVCLIVILNTLRITRYRVK